jgi:diguanylate cyclase (GGDEF)-like protein
MRQAMARATVPPPSVPPAGLLPLLTEALDAGVLILGADGTIAHCNDALGAIFGLSRAAVIEMGYQGLIDRIRATAVSPLGGLGQPPPDDGEPRTTCLEFETRDPRSVIRWLSRSFGAPERTEVIVCTDITTEVDLALAYQKMAVTDPLTGLANRRGVEQHMRREVARVMRHGYRLSFVMLDIDHFKRVNDRFGHSMGDEVLRRVAESVGKTLRTSDVAARWGGEEFLVVLTDTGLEGARMCAERIRSAVDTLDIPRVGGVTISAGVAELTRGEELSITLLRADELLYQAKAAGRNCVKAPGDQGPAGTGSPYSIGD